MSMTDLFGIGQSGVKAYRSAMGAVSENIANASTEGYNRRTVELAESPSGSGTSILYKPGISFGGVMVGSIVRANDSYLDLAARIATANHANADTRLSWQSAVQNGMDDGALGVGQLLGGMFAAVERLAGNPSDTTLRQNVLYSFEQINTSFKQTGQALSDVKAGIGTSAQTDVTTLNRAMGRLAVANEALRRAVPGSSNAAQLLDERDLALSDITSRIDATVEFVDRGVANVTYDGKAVVMGIQSHSFAVAIAGNGTLSFTLDGTAVPDPGNGTLAGLNQSADVVASRIASLNTLATQYVADVNGWHKAGFLADGTTPGTDMISGTSAATLAVLITDPAKVAARSADGRLNGNLVDIASIRTTSGIENGWTALIAAQANLVASTKAEQTATAARRDQAQNARAEVSGVDLDREAADLLRLQQAYQGCARIIQVARECTDALFAAF